MSFDEAALDSDVVLAQRDEARVLWHLATAGAQVRRALEVVDEVGFERLRGEPARSVLVATDAWSAPAARLVTALTRDTAPAMAWHGVELPRWAGPADAFLIASLDGRHPRLAGLAEQASRRGMALTVVAPGDSPVAGSAREVLVELSEDLHPRAARWAIQAPLLLALDALGMLTEHPPLESVADALDETATTCRPGGDLFTNPAKALAAELADTRPLLVGAGPLAGLAARTIAEALQLVAGVSAVAVALPDGTGRAGALLRGPTAPADLETDFFRDRVDEPTAPRARLLIIGDEGDPADPALGPRSAASVQLDEVAARRAAAALREIAEEFGVRVSGVDVPAGSALARFAAAVAFGDFTAAYLAFGVGLDPGRPSPAESGH